MCKDDRPDPTPVSTETSSLCLLLHVAVYSLGLEAHPQTPPPRPASASHSAEHHEVRGSGLLFSTVGSVRASAAHPLQLCCVCTRCFFILPMNLVRVPGAELLRTPNMLVGSH